MPEVGFDEIAVKVLEFYGMTPEFCSSEDEARGKMNELLNQKKWPCLFNSSNTTGEKQLEEFVGPNEKELSFDNLPFIGVAQQNFTAEQKSTFANFIDLYKTGKVAGMTKADLVIEMSKVVPGLNHKELNFNLDNKM